MIQYLTDKGIISVGTVLGSQMLPSGYLVSGVRDYGTMMQDLENLFPITFPKSGIVWTKTQAQEADRTRYRIDDNQGSYFRAYTNYCLFSYPSSTTPSFACAGIRDGDSVTMNRSYADDITAMINRIAADVYYPEVEVKPHTGYRFPDGYEFFIGTHSVKLESPNEYPSSGRQRREDPASGEYWYNYWYEAGYQQGTSLGDLMRHFYEAGYDENNKMLLDDGKVGLYYSFQSYDTYSIIKLDYRTRTSSTASWGTRVYTCFYLNFDRLYDVNYYNGKSWFSWIPNDVTQYNTVEDFYNYDVNQQLYFTPYPVGVAIFGGRSSHGETVSEDLFKIFLLCEKVVNNEEPDEPGSGTGGGHGTYDFGGDVIDLPPVPPVSAIATGFISVYSPTETQLQNLSHYLWSDLFSLDSLKKLFANPMDLIIGLSIIPVSPPISSVSNIKVAGFDTGIQCNKVATQWMTVSCGKIHIPRRYDTFLDYSPYTKCEIYLPYIGTRSLSSNELIGNDIEVVYRVDILTGSCTAFILINNSIVDQFNGSMTYQIPVTGSDYKSTVNSIISIAGITAGVVAGAVTGGAGTAVALGAVNAGNAVNAIENMSPDIVSHGGSSAGAGGIIASQTPYLIWQYPNESRAHGKFNELSGDTSNIKGTVNSFTGFLVCSDVNMSALGNMERDEQLEIQRLLEGGIYI